MKDEEILKIIDRFIENYFYHHAILINGDWGCGKTYFVKEKLISHIKTKKYKNEKGIEEEKDENYISLYGINNPSDISQLLYSQSLEDKVVKIGNKEAIQKHLGKPVDKTSKPFQLLSMGTELLARYIMKKTDIGDEKDIEHLLQLIPNFDNNIIIFDDLERCSCSVNDVLGYINNFVEHTNAKVIIIANEDEIGRHQAGNRELQTLVALNERIEVEADTVEDEDRKRLLGKGNKAEQKNIRPEKLDLRRRKIFDEMEEYRRIKEKVIGDTITYEPDLREIFLKIISEAPINLKLKAIIEQEIDNLVFYANKDKHRNLRTFQFFLSKANEIFNTIGDEHQNLYSTIVRYCYRTSIRLLSGRKDQPEWHDEEFGFQEFSKSLFSTDALVGYKFIDDYVRSSYIDKDHINKVLLEHETKIKEEALLKDDPYQLLREWYTSEDEEVNKWITEVGNNVENDTYTTALYPEIAYRLACIKEYGVFEELICSTFQKMNNHLETMDPSKIVPFSHERFSADGEKKIIYRAQMDEMKRIVDKRRNENQKNEYQRIIRDPKSDWTNEILAIIRAEERLKDWTFIYWISPDELMERLIKSRNNELDNFREILRAIYNGSAYYTHLADDYDNLIQIKAAITKMDGSSFGEIKKKAFSWIHHDLEECLQNKFHGYESDTTRKKDER